MREVLAGYIFIWLVMATIWPSSVAHTAATFIKAFQFEMAQP